MKAAEKRSGSEPSWWVEVKYEDGWGRHTRTDDKRWAEGIAMLLVGMYPETRVVPNIVHDAT